MTTYTFAIVIVAAADRTAAQDDLGEAFFNTGLSADGDVPATHWVSSGAFDNAELNAIVNAAAWPRTVYFGQDWRAAVETEGLQPVAPPKGTT